MTIKAAYQKLRKAMRCRGRGKSYWEVHQVLSNLDIDENRKRVLLCDVSMSLRYYKKTDYSQNLAQRLLDFKSMGLRTPCLHPAKVSGDRRPLP